MPRSRRAPNYDRKLTRRIVLDDGTRIVTLRDAANLFAERFATVTRWRVLEIAIERLIAAAESAERDKVNALLRFPQRTGLSRASPKHRAAVSVRGAATMPVTISVEPQYMGMTSPWVGDLTIWGAIFQLDSSDLASTGWPRWNRPSRCAATSARSRAS